MIDELVKKSELLASKSGTKLHRTIYDSIDWTSKLIGIKGARGCGKTTLLLQHMIKLELSPNEAMYISLDDFFFTKNNLIETAEAFILKGGKYLFIDEVHKYPKWSQHIKNIYDFYDLNVVFTGSSIIDINKETADLSRRAVMYDLHGLSYREYLMIAKGYKDLPLFTIKELTSGKGTMAIRSLLPEDFVPYKHFETYLKSGYYPFAEEGLLSYYTKLEQIVRIVVTYDMAELSGFDTRNAHKMLQLLSIIADNAPFKPNMNQLAEKLGMNRATVYRYMYFLEQAKLIHMVHATGIHLGTLQKPEKIFLENTNLNYALSDNHTPNKGTLRETFALNQLKTKYLVEIPKEGDFFVSSSYTLEVGGKSKNKKQIESIPNSFRVLDDVEYTGIKDIIPIWLLGFMY